MWPLKNKNKNQNQKSDMKVNVMWAAIVALFSFDTQKENVLTEEHGEQLNAELVRLQADNKKFKDDLVIANQSIDTLKGEKTQLETDLKNAQADVTKHVATIAENKTTIESLKQNGGTAAANVVVEQETGKVVEQADKLVTNLEKTENMADAVALLRSEGYK